MSKMKYVYGVLLYRITKSGQVKVFLCQENGPRYWVKRTEHIWGVPKGKASKKETALDVVKREFKEEIGVDLPSGQLEHLLTVAMFNENRVLSVYVMEVSEKIMFASSELSTKEWPVATGNLVTYPEISTAKWFGLEKARQVALPRQKVIFTALEERLKNSTH